MGHDQRLHWHRVFLHQVGDAGVRVNHYFIGQSHLTAAVAFFSCNELFSKRPMPVIHRHANRCIGINHLLGIDDFQLNRIRVKAKALGRSCDLAVITFNQIERPVRRAWQLSPLALATRQVRGQVIKTFWGLKGGSGACHVLTPFLKSSLNMG